MTKSTCDAIIAWALVFFSLVGEGLLDKFMP